MDEQPIPAANINESRKRSLAIHVLPQLDHESCDTNVLKDVFFGIRLLCPTLDETSRMLLFQLGVRVLHPRLRKQHIVMDSLLIALNPALAVLVNDHEQLESGPYELVNGSVLLVKEEVGEGDGPAGLCRRPFVNKCYALDYWVVEGHIRGRGYMREIDDESPLNRLPTRVALVDEACLVKRLVSEGVSWYELADDMPLELKPDKGGNVGHEGQAISLVGWGCRVGGTILCVVQDIRTEEPCRVDVWISDQVVHDTVKHRRSKRTLVAVQGSPCCLCWGGVCVAAAVTGSLEDDGWCVKRQLFRPECHCEPRLLSVSRARVVTGRV